MVIHIELTFEMSKNLFPSLNMTFETVEKWLKLCQWGNASCLWWRYKGFNRLAYWAWCHWMQLTVCQPYSLLHDQGCQGVRQVWGTCDLPINQDHLHVGCWKRVSWGSELLMVQNVFWIQVSEIINWVSHDTCADERRNTLIGHRLCSFSSFSPAAWFCQYSSRKALASSTIHCGWSITWSMRQSAGTRQIGHGQCDLMPLIRAITHLSTYYGTKY